MTPLEGGARAQRTPPSRSRPVNAGRLVRDVERRVLLAGRAQEALLPGERLVVAVSGGPDSTALLLILTSLAPDLGLTLSVAHVDHGVRPAAERAADADFVRALSARLGLPCTVKPVRARPTEDALRRARYAALRRAAAAFGATAVVLGHTADDQAETVLLHLVRGAGLAGLAGMRPRAPWPLDGEGPAIVRPLLGLRRWQTEAYVAAKGETPRADLTNRDPRYARNRLRTLVLPALLAENPNAVEAIGRAARGIEQALALVEAEAGRAWPSVAELYPEAVVLSAPALTALPAAVRQAVIRRALALRCPLAEIDAAAVARVDDLLAGHSGRRAALGHGVWAARTAAGVRIGSPRAPAPPIPATSLPVPGTARAGPWAIAVTPAEGASPADPYTLDVAAGAAAEGLIVRSRRPGDRIRLPGGTRKVQDVLVDAKVPREERDAVPLLCDATGRVLWVVGHGADVSVRATSGSGLRVRLRKAETHRHQPGGVAPGEGTGASKSRQGH